MLSLLRSEPERAARRETATLDAATYANAARTLCAEKHLSFAMAVQRLDRFDEARASLSATVALCVSHGSAAAAPPQERGDARDGGAARAAAKSLRETAAALVREAAVPDAARPLGQADEARADVLAELLSPRCAATAEAAVQCLPEDDVAALVRRLEAAPRLETPEARP